MVTIEDKKKCSGCSACYNVCPKKAILMKADAEGFIYPHIDNENCVHCNLCDKVCPYKTLWEPQDDLKECHVGYNLNDSERASSSSGGIFTLFANCVLEQNGVVFGAAFNDEFQVYHLAITEKVDLDKIVGSKYLQSKIGDSFCLAKDYLNKGKVVLFVGTTCQIAGLKQFLQKEYNNLICVDFVCLGIPSPLVWDDYISTFFNKSEIEGVNFKNKSLGWHTFSLELKTKSKKIVQEGKKTLFFSGYFKGLYSRPSCSECQFKNFKNRVSDITLSDSWGCENFASELDDNRGLSNIIIHTQKGKEVFKLIEQKMKSKSVDFYKAIDFNKNYFISLPYGKKRAHFWKAYYHMPKEKLFRRYCTSNNRIRKIVREMKKHIRSLLK